MRVRNRGFAKKNSLISLPIREQIYVKIKVLKLHTENCSLHVAYDHANTDVCFIQINVLKFTFF